MKLPTLLSKSYVESSKFFPEFMKPTLRGLYYSFTKLLNYCTFNMFVALDIETTPECNIKCSYCPTAFHNRGKKLMDEKLFKKIIDELAEIPYKGRLSPHFYGEPLLDNRLPKLLAYAREKLVDIWNKEKFMQLRKDLLRGKFKLDICKNCKK